MQHTDGSLKLILYTGFSDATKRAVKNPKFLAQLQPERLSKYDIVLTSFETIKSELYQSISPYIADEEAKSGPVITFICIFTI